MARDEHTAENDVETFAGKLFEWLAEFGVDNASERARLVAGSFVRDGWTRVTPPEGEGNPDACPRCGHPNLDHYRGFCHHAAGPVAMCGCRVIPPGRNHTTLGESVEITVTRSAGTDGAVVVFIDTSFDPRGNGDSPGLRVLVNDDDVYAPVLFKVDHDGDHDAEAKKLTVRFDEIAYAIDETKENS